MNMTFTNLSFTGTAEEFASVERFFQAEKAAGRRNFTMTEDTMAAPEGGTPARAAAGDEPAAEVPSEAAFLAVFKRVPFNPQQRACIRLIYEAGETGTTIADIARAAGKPIAEVKSMFRNFGKRTAHTPEWPKGSTFFKQTWLGNQNRYWLHPAMRRAIDAGDITL